MDIRWCVFGSLLLVICCWACSRKIVPEDPAVWNKVKLDFRNIDNQGLAGPENGKVAIHYEFCIPAETKFWKQIHRLDSTAVRQKGARGRVGCGGDQWLIIGHTQQARYKRVLYELARLPWVKTIEQTYWE